jgi:hypothetical protein
MEAQTELKQALKETLNAKGVLSSLQGNIRAHIFQILNEKVSFLLYFSTLHSSHLGSLF